MAKAATKSKKSAQPAKAAKTAKAKKPVKLVKKTTTKAAKPVAKPKAVKATVKAVKATAKKAVKKVETNVVKLPTVVKDAMNKTQQLEAISGATGVAKKDVGNVINCLGELITSHIGPKGPGEFTLAGFLKVMVIQKPAVKERKGINPFTKEPTIFKAKPARRVLKVRALKKLKDAANKK